MLTWRSHLHAALDRLRRSHRTAPPGQVEQILANILDARTVRFVRPDGSTFDDNTTLETLLGQPCLVQLEVEYDPADREAVQPQATASGFRPDGPVLARPARPKRTPSEDELIEAFVHDFVRLEEKSKFMWAGFVVKQMLPRIGVARSDAKDFLDLLRNREIVLISKVTNPNNPDYPATAVRLNREHERVREVLQHVSDDNAD